ncbi:hypothetical protein GCM10018785_48530 [Streptomyces longispororuber]|uniref:Chaplin domain-containing protein n=1 Tax=Streptomyces longispororuber TaxID=68230 RepID=A0A918ZWM4_9ACTN|nr:chaplin [Streptomyces longispororuber]GHE74583.1 hypothetical protein GCM10018785_48530 [Streptomyces longispororuber]
MSIAKKAALAVAVAGLAVGASATAALAADADGRATNSPGIASGNILQVPADVPVNVTGLSANVVGAHNPAVAERTVNH